MELELLQLAFSYLCAVKAGSLTLSFGERCKHCASQSFRNFHTENNKTNSAAKSTGLAKLSKQNRLSGKALHRQNSALQANDSPATVNLEPPNANRPRLATKGVCQVLKLRDGVPQTAWLLSSFTPLPIWPSSSWAGRHIGGQRYRARHHLWPPHQHDPAEHGEQQLTEQQDSSGDNEVPAALRRCRAAPIHHSPQLQGGELLKKCHLDDEPLLTLPQQPEGAMMKAAVPLVAAISAVARRLLGGDGGVGNDSNATTDVSFKAAGGGGNSETAIPKRVHSTPHLVGSHALGADGGSGGSYNSAAAAAAAVSVLTSAGGALGGLAERAVDAPVRGLRELNRAVTAGVSDFLASDSGRRLSEQVAAEMSTGALMAPVYLTEELVKARMRSLLRSHTQWLTVYLAVRVSLATAALHCVKELLRSTVRRRGPRWLCGAVHFLCDVMLPTCFFGPLLGVTVAALQLTGRGPGGAACSGGGGGGRISIGGDTAAALQRPLTSALPAVAVAASDAVAATVTATVTPVAAAASALVGGVGGTRGAAAGGAWGGRGAGSAFRRSTLRSLDRS